MTAGCGLGLESHRRFAAQVAHEMRTPVTRARALIEVGLADPDADEQSLRAACERVLVVCSEQEAIIEALITLARSQEGLEDVDPVDLAAVAARVLEACAPLSAGRAVRIGASLGAATVWGDECLLERLVTNLVENAIVHNHPGGWLRVVTAAEGDKVFLGVTNSGTAVPAEAVEDLTRPFRRCRTPGPRRTGGSGLGLSIVAGVATAHGAELDLRARPAGGLSATVAFTPSLRPDRGPG